MDSLSGLRRKNAAAAPAKDGTTGLSTLLPKCKRESIICAQNFQIEIINQPDAKTQC